MSQRWNTFNVGVHKKAEFCQKFCVDLSICDIVFSIKLLVADVGEVMGSKISQAKFNS